MYEFKEKEKGKNTKLPKIVPKNGKTCQCHTLLVLFVFSKRGTPLCQTLVCGMLQLFQRPHPVFHF